ncbi:TPA: helix-turn-helix domain-containing protein [Candidatus Poribacteria bacterium]|nr:helix-turn-helix domain-containing protein [Candidatus Poribacteria bacterium]
MPAKIYHVRLTVDERNYLKQLISAGSNKARKLTRARILLLADESPQGPAEIDERISKTLNISTTTIANIRERFVKEGLESAINEKPRSGRPRKWARKEESESMLMVEA